MAQKKKAEQKEVKTAAGQQDAIREEALREAVNIIRDLTDALEELHIRLYGLEGVASMGDFAMQAEADCGAASKMFFSLSESLRDESERAEAAVQAATERRKINAELHRVYQRMVEEMTCIHD